MNRKLKNRPSASRRLTNHSPGAIWALAGLSFLVSGCHSPSARRPETLTEYYEAMAEAYCGALRECHPGRLLESNLADPGACEADAIRSLQSRTNADRLVAAGRSTFDSSSAAECVAGLRTAYCESNRLSLRAPAACEHVVRGVGQQGSPCETHLECSDATYCQRSGPCGTCEPRLSVDADCTDSRSCMTGLSCLGRCQQTADLGESCRTLPCANTFLTCNEDFICEPYNRVPLAIGAECGDASCVDGATCVFDSAGRGTCQNYVTVLPGAECVRSLPETCPTGYACAFGLCRALPTEGESCRTAPCGPGLFCASPSSICRTPLPNGEPCIVDQHCQSLSCQEQVCADFRLCES